MSRDLKATTTFFQKVTSNWPTWALVLLFLVIATGVAFAGLLDDWLRAMLAVSFAGIALVLGMRANMALGGRTGVPPAPEHDPPPSQPNEAS